MPGDTPGDKPGDMPGDKTGDSARSAASGARTYVHLLPPPPPPPAAAGDGAPCGGPATEPPLPPPPAAAPPPPPPAAAEAGVSLAAGGGAGGDLDEGGDAEWPAALGLGPARRTRLGGARGEGTGEGEEGSERTVSSPRWRERKGLCGKCVCLVCVRACVLTQMASSVPCRFLGLRDSDMTRTRRDSDAT
jgi:hypothetical protein